MSEGSDASNGEKINRHPLEWRSEKLNRLVAMLDDRTQKSAKHSFHRKERVEKSPSAAPPPADAPSWTLKPTRERESTPPAPEPHVSMPTAGPFSTEEDSSESD
jgi:hypothetical protein